MAQCRLNSSMHPEKSTKGFFFFVIFLNTRSNAEFVIRFQFVLNFPCIPPNTQYHIKVLPIHSAQCLYNIQYFNLEGGGDSKCGEGKRISLLQTHPHWTRGHNGYQRFFLGVYQPVVTLTFHIHLLLLYSYLLRLSVPFSALWGDLYLRT